MSELAPSENTEPTDLDFIAIGRIIAPWGAQGKIKVQPETDFPQRFFPGQQVFVNGKPLTILEVSWHRARPILKLSTIDRVEEARQLRGKDMEIPRSQVQPLPEDHYYYFQLIGLEVRTTKEEKLGKITEIITGESNDVYVVDTARGQVLIPAIADVVKSVDVERGYMEIEPISGLLELNRKKAS